MEHSSDLHIHTGQATKAWKAAPLIWKVQAAYPRFLKEENFESVVFRLAESILLSVCIALEFIPKKLLSLQCIATSCQKPFL